MFEPRQDLNQSAFFRLADFSTQADLERTRLLYGQGGTAVAANFINSLVVAAVMWGEFSAARILAWLAMVWVATAIRYYFVLKFKKAQVTIDNCLQWQSRIIKALFLLGAAWGSLAVVLYPPDSPFHQVFLAYVLGGMCAGAVVVNSAVFPAFLAFSIPAAAPMGLRFLAHMDAIHLAMGAMAMVYLAAMTAVARHINSTSEKFIYLDFERTEQKLKAERLNEKLLVEVAERKDAERKLRQEKEIFVGGPAVVFQWRASEGWPVEYVSPNVRQFGYEPDDLAGGKTLFAQIVSHKDLKRVMDEVSGHARAGAKSFQQVYRIVTAAGEDRWVEDFTIPIRDENAKITHYHGYLSDITESKKIADELRQSEERYRLLVELSPYAIVVHSGQKVVYANAAGVSLMLEEGNADFVGRDIMDFVHPDYKQFVQARMRTLAETGQNLPMTEEKFVKINGEVIDVEVVSASLMHQGKPAAMSIFRDITARKAAEDERKRLISMLAESAEKADRERNKAEQATRFKDQFVSMVSHDLRSPLSAIVSVLKLMGEEKEPPMDPRRQEMANSVIESGERMLTMLDELLNLTRLKTGQLAVHPCFFDLSALSRAAIENNRFAADRKMITLEDHIPLGARGYGDQYLLGQVLQNLVLNAVKFCSKGDRISIFAPDGRKSGFAVKDTGKGVDPAFLPDLFKHEVKTTSVGAGGETGTGLGLPFSHDIMQAHGGSLEVVSSPGQGALFIAELPHVTPKIMVVDDDTITRQILVETLGRIGVQVVQAVNGREALKIMENEVFHLVVVDLFMPVFDGFSFLKEAREAPENKKIPILVLTSDDKLETRDKAFQMGADDFIHKSLVRTDFLPRVNRLLYTWRG